MCNYYEEKHHLFNSICHPLQLVYSYSDLSDIVQLDGPADNTDSEEEERVALEENDFLGLINAEAIKALQEGEGSSDGSTSGSSTSDSANELANVEEEVSALSLPQQQLKRFPTVHSVLVRIL